MVLLPSLRRLRSVRLLFIVSSAGFLTASLPHTATAEPLSGTLHPRAADLPDTTIGTPIWGDDVPIGTFSVDLDVELGIRPAEITVTTDSGGLLVGIAEEPLNRIAGPFRDPFSSYALRTDSLPDGLCPFGVEDGCWREGDPPLPADSVVAAFCAALDFDPLACPFWAQRMRAPFRSGPFRPLESLFGPTVLPGFGFTSLTLTFVGDDPPPSPEPPEPPSAADVCLASLSPAELNLFLQLACLSEPASGDAPGALEVIDVDALFSQDPGRCSLLQPQFCRLVVAFFNDAWASRRIADASSVFPVPPFGGWIWESGIEYSVVIAEGDLAPYAGGTVFALGPELARTGGLRVDDATQNNGISEPETPTGVTLLVTTSGPEPDATIFFGTVPEPSGSLLALASVATLAALARRRSRVLATRMRNAIGASRRT